MRFEEPELLENPQNVKLQILDSLSYININLNNNKSKIKPETAWRAPKSQSVLPNDSEKHASVLETSKFTKKNGSSH